MNRHIPKVKQAPLQGNPRERRAGEGAYAIRKMLKAKLFDIDGFPIMGKARIVMGEDGKPERLVMSGAVPEMDVLEAKTREGAFHLQLEKGKEGNGKDELRMKITKPCGPDFEYELQIAGAMRVGGEVMGNPLGWENIAEEVGIDGIARELEKIARDILVKRQAPSRDEILTAEFVFNDGVRMSGRELFGDAMEVAREGTVKVGKRQYLALQARGEMRALIAQCSLANLTDFGPAFVNALADPNAFTAGIGGKAYSGKIY